MNELVYLDLTVFMEGDDSVLSVNDALRRARSAATSGHHSDAARLYLIAMETMLGAGYINATETLLAELRMSSDLNSVPEALQARILDVEGGLMSRKGLHRIAQTIFERVHEFGQTLADKEIVDRAEHQLANQALYLGDLDLATTLYRKSFDTKMDLGDYIGAVHVVLSLATVAQEKDDLTQAESTLDVAEDLLRYLRNVPDARFKLALGRGQLAAKRGGFPQAIKFFRTALRHARRSGDREAEVAALQNLGSGCADAGEHRKALRWYRRGVQLAQDIGALALLGSLHLGLALALIHSGRRREAMSEFDEARLYFDQVGDRRHAARAAADLGALALEVGDLERARVLLVGALETFRTVGDREWEGRILRNLAELELASGNHPLASSLIDECASLLNSDAVDERAQLFRRAAEVWLSARPPDISHAQVWFERSLSEGSSKLTDWAWRCAQVAATLVTYGGYEVALSYYGRSLEAYQSADEVEMAFHVRNDRAIALTHLERFAEARYEFNVCLQTAARLKNRAMEQQADFNLGEMSHREGLMDEAIERLRRAASLAQELGDSDAEGSAFGSLGIACTRAERWEEATEAFERALDLAQRDHDVSGEAVAVGGLAGIDFAAGRYVEAARRYRRAVALSTRIEDWRHVAEDLGGLVETLAVLARRREMERAAQSLVDLAQDTHHAPHAPEALARSARWWLRRGQFEEAADLYAVALALTGTVSHGDEQQMIELLARISLFIALHDRSEAASNSEALFSKLRSSLDSLESGLAETMEPILEHARHVVAEMPMDAG